MYPKAIYKKEALKKVLKHDLDCKVKIAEAQQKKLKINVSKVRR